MGRVRKQHEQKTDLSFGHFEGISCFKYERKGGWDDGGSLVRRDGGRGWSCMGMDSILRGLFLCFLAFS